MNEEILLETKRLTKSFGGFVAVNNLNLKIVRGHIHALIGPNGAGKTTCFNLITKFLLPTTGQILLDGIDITALNPGPVARLGMVRSFQISSIFPHFTALENVRFALQRRRGRSFDFWRSDSVLHELDERALTLLHQVGLADAAMLPASELAYGRKRALEIATTLALDPKLLLLDEPTAGMGSEEIARITDIIGGLARQRTVLIVEHNLKVVSNISDHVTVLARGEVLAEGDYASIAANTVVREAYMGAEQ